MTDVNASDLSSLSSAYVCATCDTSSCNGACSGYATTRLTASPYFNAFVYSARLMVPGDVREFFLIRLAQQTAVSLAEARRITDEYIAEMREMDEVYAEHVDVNGSFA